MTKRIVSMLLAVVMMLSAVSFVAPASALVNLPHFSSKKPIKTYALVSNDRVYPFTSEDSILIDRKHWVDCATDECWIIEMKPEKHLVKISYPINGGKDRAVRWFDRADFLFNGWNGNFGKALYCYTAPKKMTTYRWIKDTRKCSEYGYISKGDTVYVLRGGSWPEVLYPVPGGYKVAYLNTWVSNF